MAIAVTKSTFIFNHVKLFKFAEKSIIDTTVTKHAIRYKNYNNDNYVLKQK